MCVSSASQVSGGVCILCLVVIGCFTAEAGCLAPQVMSSSDPIAAISGLTVQRSLFEAQHLQQPIIVSSPKEASRYFDDPSVQKLADKVDFQSYVVVLFAWQGSGQDQLTYTLQELHPETAQFSYRPGLTRDLRQHFQVYAVRKDVTLRVNGKEISLSPVSDDGEFVRVEIRGRLNAQVMAIGGETTGVVITAGNIEFELEVRDEKMRNRCQQLHEQTVFVRGNLHRKLGVEIPERWIVALEKLESVDKQTESR